MKTRLTKAKSKSALCVTRQLFSRSLCFGALLLICSSASAQNLFVSGSDAGGGKIFEFTWDGVQSIFASGLGNPQGLAFDSARNLFVADGGNVYKFDPLGARSTFASGLVSPIGLAIDRAGNLFVVDGSNIDKFTPEGMRTTFAVGLDGPFALAIDSAGNLFVVDEGDIDGLGGAIYRFKPNGARNAFVSARRFCIGPGVAIDGAGNLFVPDWCTGNIYKFTSNGRRSTFVSGLNESFSFLAF